MASRIRDYLDNLAYVRIAITGASGLLGRYLLKTSPSDTEVFGVVHRTDLEPSRRLSGTIRVDLEDASALEKILQVRPDAIIHTAGEGRVDAVEGRLSDFLRLNLEIARELASWTAAHDVPFVFVSSNAVFGGARAIYSDHSPVDPINDYGRLKAEAEAAVILENPSALIVRPILMYGLPSPGGRSNPAMSWVNDLSRGKTIRVVSDVETQPLWAQDAAQSIWLALERGITGPLNMSGGQTVTLFEFAQNVAAVFDLDPTLVLEARSSEFPSIAPRPGRTCFDLLRLKTVVGFTPQTVIDGLSLFRQELEEVL